MATKPESRLQRKIQDAIKQQYPKAWLFKVHGGPFQPAGIPDIIGCLKGHFFAFEVKRPGCESDVTIIQQRTLRRMRDAGALARVVTSPEQALHALRVWLQTASWSL